MDRPLRLHLNENTGGCSPAVIEAIRRIDPLDVSIYPDYAPITKRCEDWFGVNAGWVQLTNGLDEGLYIAAQSARVGASDGAAAIIVEPAFEEYAVCATAAGLGVERVLWDPRAAFPLDALLARLSPDVRLVYLTDPNNPTGLAIPAGAVDRIATAAPQTMVLVDEAYAEFSGRTLIGAGLDRHRNLVVGRTFAKAHGLAALRVGALIAHPETLAPLKRRLPPFSVNICAVRALEAALADRAHLEEYVRQSSASKQLIYAACDRWRLRYWPSDANFVLIDIGPSAAAVVAAVASRGVLIKDRSHQPGCAGLVRITAGLVTHTQQCLAALESAGAV